MTLKLGWLVSTFVRRAWKPRQAFFIVDRLRRRRRGLSDIELPKGSLSICILLEAIGSFVTVPYMLSELHAWCALMSYIAAIDFDDIGVALWGFKWVLASTHSPPDRSHALKF